MLNRTPGVHGHDGPEHSKLNKGGRAGGHYTDHGTRHHMPKEANPGEAGWVDKHEATRHSRKSMKTNRFY
jgi:hypothetical protein